MSVNAFHEAKKIEAEGLRILEPLISHRSNGRYVLTNKGRLSREIQLKYGDVLSEIEGQIVWAEMKVEKKKYIPRWQETLSIERRGNIFLEEFSNLSMYTRGWLDHLNTDYLLYYFIDDDYLYSFDFPKLKYWALRAPCLTLCNTREQAEREGYHGRMYDYPRKQQGIRVQANDTWGRVIPINHLLNEIPNTITRPKRDFSRDCEEDGGRRPA